MNRIRLAVLLLVLLPGCVSAEVRESIVALRRDHETFRRAVVPNPSYDAEEKKTVVGLGADISTHLDKLEELTR